MEDMDLGEMMQFFAGAGMRVLVMDEQGVFEVAPEEKKSGGAGEDKERDAGAGDREGVARRP